MSCIVEVLPLSLLCYKIANRIKTQQRLAEDTVSLHQLKTQQITIDNFRVLFMYIAVPFYFGTEFEMPTKENFRKKIKALDDKENVKESISVEGQVVGQCEVFYEPYKINLRKQQYAFLTTKNPSVLQFLVWITFYVTVTLFDMMYIVQIFLVQFVSFVKEYEKRTFPAARSTLNKSARSDSRI